MLIICNNSHPSLPTACACCWICSNPIHCWHSNECSKLLHVNDHVFFNSHIMTGIVHSARLLSPKNIGTLLTHSSVTDFFFSINTFIRHALSFSKLIQCRKYKKAALELQKFIHLWKKWSWWSYVANIEFFFTKNLQGSQNMKIIASQKNSPKE